jgi:hypothetical protein
MPDAVQAVNRCPRTDEVLLAVITGVGRQHVDRAERLGQDIEARQGGADLLRVVGVLGEVLRDDQA